MEHSSKKLLNNVLQFSAWNCWTLTNPSVWRARLNFDPLCKVGFPLATLEHAHCVERRPAEKYQSNQPSASLVTIGLILCNHIPTYCLKKKSWQWFERSVAQKRIWWPKSDQMWSQCAWWKWTKLVKMVRNWGLFTNHYRLTWPSVEWCEFWSAEHSVILHRQHFSQKVKKWLP